MTSGLAGIIILWCSEEINVSAMDGSGGYYTHTLLTVANNPEGKLIFQALLFYFIIFWSSSLRNRVLGVVFDVRDIQWRLSIIIGRSRNSSSSSRRCTPPGNEFPRGRK